MSRATASQHSTVARGVAANAVQHCGLSGPREAAQVARIAAPEERNLDAATFAPPPTKRLLTLDPATLPPKKRPLPPDLATLPPKKRPRPPALTAWAGAPEAPADAGAIDSCYSQRYWICRNVTARPCPRSTPTTLRPPCAPFRVPHCSRHKGCSHATGAGSVLHARRAGLQRSARRLAAPCARPDPPGCAQGQYKYPRDPRGRCPMTDVLGPPLPNSLRLPMLEAAAAAAAAAVAVVDHDDNNVNDEDDATRPPSEGAHPPGEGDEEGAHPPGEGDEEQSQPAYEHSEEEGSEEEGSERSLSAGDAPAPRPASAVSRKRGRSEARDDAALAAATPVCQTPVRRRKRSRRVPLTCAAAAAAALARPAHARSCWRGRTVARGSTAWHTVQAHRCAIMSAESGTCVPAWHDPCLPSFVIRDRGVYLAALRGPTQSTLSVMQRQPPELQRQQQPHACMSCRHAMPCHAMPCHAEAACAVRACGAR